MAFIVTNSSELNININDGWKDLDIPKFRLFMQVAEPNITIWWADNEKGKQGITRNLVMDYNDVLFGAYAPSSATEIQSIINGYIISAWTDIIGMLGSYVPYVGATTNVDLGAFGLSADTISFSLSPVGSPGTGEIAYDGATGSLSYLFDNSSVECNIGQTIHANVHNAEGSPLVKGDIVYLSGSSGNKASVKKARNISDSTSATTFGVCAENIGTNQNGFVICQGRLDGLNTSMYSDGDILYLGSSYGTTTNVKPYAPNHLVYVAVVEESSVGNGILYIRIQNGYQLNEIHDVDLITTPPSTGDVLTYNGSLWVNQAPASGSGTVTSIATTSPITGGTITTSGTIGIQDAVADGTTKGASTFTASDFNSASGVISIDYTNGQSASALNKGFLTSADWSTFNSKEPSLTKGNLTEATSSVLTISGGTSAVIGSGTSIEVKQATALQGGYLSSTDWSTFNNKQATLVSGTNIKTINGISILGSGDLDTGYTLSVQALTSSPADGQTIYFGNLPKAPVTTANISKVYIPRAGVIKRAEIYCYSGTAGTNQAWSGYIRLNNTTDTLISTLSVATNERVFSNSSLAISVVAGDYFEIKFINPTWATNPLTTIFGGYIYIE
jgi:hypothetical protein